MKFILLIFASLFLLQSFSIAQENDEEELITVVGDTLIGKRVDGQMIREVYGNVVLTQGDVTITCNQAIQFIGRNDAELIGDVVVVQDSITINTEHGFYYGDERIAESKTRVTLDDKKVILSADSGKYFFEEDRAFFQSDVELFDSTSTLTSEELTYFQQENRAVAVEDVKIVDQDNIIYADSLIHFRDTKISFAINNVKIKSKDNNVVIYGDHLEDYAEKEYTLIDKNPLLIQIDSTYINKIDTLSTGSVDTIRTVQLDTLIIKSLFMEAFRDTTNKFIAKDSVKILRGGFASVNSLTTYYKQDERIVTYQINNEDKIPIIWNENTQLVGDSVTIFLRNNDIRLIDILDDAFIISQNENYPLRYDQISGNKILMYFDNNDLNRVKVEGKVLSIYYLYDDGLTNGLTKSSSSSAEIVFENNEVSVVKLYGQPASEYYPEPQVMEKERTFTLPGFKIYNNRPVKGKLLQRIINNNKEIYGSYNIKK